MAKRRLLGLGEKRRECVRRKLVAALVAGANEDAMSQKTRSQFSNQKHDRERERGKRVWMKGSEVMGGN